MPETWVQSYARYTVSAALEQIQNGRLEVLVRTPGEKDKTFTFCRNDESEITPELDIAVVFNTPEVWVRLCQHGDLGFAESYLLQDIECADLTGLFMLFIANRNILDRLGNNMLRQLISFLSRPFVSSRNTPGLALSNASFHYDASNELFRRFLSPDMNYSSAIWSSDRDPEESLEQAQRRKLQNIFSKARICSSDHVLDIGCGWGDLAIQAVKATGCRVTGLTLSKEQKKLAEARVEEAGLADHITILLCDYRQAPKPPGGYDKVISVEMVEHVGDKLLNSYFKKIDELLRNGGIMVVQGITLVNKLHGTLSSPGGFLDHYIFPGGYPPTIHQLLTSIHSGSATNLEVESVENIGQHYIKTLQCWRSNFEINWQEIHRHLFKDGMNVCDTEAEAFRRKWLYYFMYCEAGFRKRILGDYVVSALKNGL